MASYKRRHRNNKRRRTKRARRRQRGSGSNDAVVFCLDDGAGFGSVFNFLCKAYINAKDWGQHFFVKSEPSWRYTYKDGWHDYFKSLTEYDPSKTYDNLSESRWMHMGAGMDSLPMEKYTQCIKEIFVLNDDIQQRVEEFIKGIGGPYKSIYVRRGDKTSGEFKENNPTPVADVLKISDITAGDKVFIQTDDYEVVEELKALLPSENIFTLTPPTSDGSKPGDTPEKKKEHTEELLISCMVFVRAMRGWTDNRSNIGRIHKMYSPDSIVLYPVESNNQDISGSTIIEPERRPLP
jgi:hypothetical protein